MTAPHYSVMTYRLQDHMDAIIRDLLNILCLHAFTAAV